MNWERLLSLKRFGDTQKRIRNQQNEIRLGFEVDYDRIVFSSPFRSLQDKTQVIPFSKTDFVHTRLTHSLEVSVVGRSLGRMAGVEILKVNPDLQKEHGYQANDFGAIIAAASLAHDIGNPPFGHSGEKAIGQFFKTGKGKEFESMLTKVQYQDLCLFEGNANGLKILTESINGNEGGLRLTYASLGSYIKYPRFSYPNANSNHVACKKFGVFKSEEAIFEDIIDDLGLKISGEIVRHPLAYLVEAADDICYTIIDFEDGINLGWISEDYALEYFIKLVKENIDTKKYNSLMHTSQRIAYLRSLAINNLIVDSVDQFLKNYQNIMTGQYPHALLDKSKYKAQMEDIISISKEKVYRSENVLKKEIIGYKIINSLLKNITTAALNKFQNKETSYDKLVLRLIPKNYPIVDEKSIYKTFLNSACFVASLSDSKAMQLEKSFFTL